MKIAFVSDIHGGARPLEIFFNYCKEKKVDQIALLGDALYHGPRNPITESYDAPKSAALLNEWKDRIIAVRGNCDSEVDQMMIQYPMMADYSLLTTGLRKWYLTHGHLLSPDNLPPLKRGDVFVSGHTHLWKLEEKNGILIFNPGSITLPKGGNLPTFGLYEEGRLQILSLKEHQVLKELIL